MSLRAATTRHARARPGYPVALVDDLVELARLEPGGRVVEIGPGTGQLTLPLARRGIQVVGVELGADMVAVARRKLAPYPCVDIVNAAFETLDPHDARFDAVIAATCWHWLDPSVRYELAAAALRDGGALVILSTEHPLPADIGDPFFTEIQEVYVEIGEGSPGGGPPRAEAIGDLRDDIDASGLFGPRRGAALPVGSGLHGPGVPRPPRHVFRPPGDGAGAQDPALGRDPASGRGAAGRARAQALPQRPARGPALGPGLRTLACNHGGMAVHEVAQTGFGNEAQAYERARPGYPPEAVAWIVDRLGIGPGRRVADLAAGTGKLTRLLTPSGAHLVAVEPVAAMRDVLHGALPRVAVTAGIAEALGFRDGSFDAITVAQAFHWFDAERALAELHRVLRPDGRLALVWNARDRSVDWVDRLWSVMDRVEKRAPWRRHDEWRESAFVDTRWFGPLHEATFRHEQVLSVEGVIDRFRSVSHVASLPAERRADVLDEVREVLATHPDTHGRDDVAIPYRVDCYWARRT